MRARVSHVQFSGDYDSCDENEYNEYQPLNVSMVGMGQNTQSHGQSLLKREGYGGSNRFPTQPKSNETIAAELNLSIPPFPAPTVTDRMKIYDMDFMTWDPATPGRMRGTPNKHDLQGTFYSCELCGRQNHCWEDCFSVDEKRRLIMRRFAHCKEGWESWANKALARAQVFKDFNPSQKQDRF